MGARIFLAGDEHRARAIRQRRGSARRHRALRAERGLEAGQRLGGGVGTRRTVFAHRACLGDDRDDLIGEFACCLCGASLLLAFDREGFLLCAVDLIFGRDIFRRVAHAHIGGAALGEVRIGHRVEAHHRHPAHRFDTGADEHLARAELNLPGGDVDRAHRGAAETVDRHAADRQRQVGEQADKARDVEALLPFRKGASHDDVLDIGGVHAGPLDKAAHHLCREIIGPHPRQRALARRMKGGTGKTRNNHVSH